MLLSLQRELKEDNHRVHIKCIGVAIPLVHLRALKV